MAYQAIPPVAGSDAWATAQQALMKSLVPELTRFEYIKPGTSPIGTAIAAPGAAGTMEGGSLAVASNTTWQRFAPATFFTAKTGKFGIAFRAKFPAITAASVAYLGLVNAAADHVLAMGAVESASATHFVLQIIGAGTTSVTSTLAGDTSVHDIIITGDGTTVTVKADTVTIASTTTLTNLSDEALSIASFASAALTPGVVVSRIYFGAVAA